MVANITLGNSLYGVLGYNAKKVDYEKAKVLDANKLFYNREGTFDILTCLNDFNNCIPKHFRTEKPIIHISLNPHPDDILTDEQLTDIANEYMEKLGYGNQPYIVYKHEDIERHHIHIVSLRVDERGRKIDDKFEWKRSKNITRELEQKYSLRSAEKQQRPDIYSFRKINPDTGDVKMQISNLIKHVANRYHYLSFNEYRTLLSLYNISAEEVKGEVKGKAYNGIIYSATDDKGNKIGNPIKSSRFDKSVGYDALQEHYINSKEIIKEKRLAQKTKRIIETTRKNYPNRKEFEKELLRQNINVIFRENQSGRIYGVTFIDHNNHCVLNGSRLGKEYSANTFQEWFATTHKPIEIEQQQDNDKTAYHKNENEFENPFDLQLFVNNGIDAEEEAFIRQLKRKKKKQHKI